MRFKYNRLRENLGWRKLTSLNLVVLQDAFNELGSDKSRSDCKALRIEILNRAVEADLLIKNPAFGLILLWMEKQSQKDEFYRGKRWIFYLKIYIVMYERIRLKMRWIESLSSCEW